MKHRITLTFVLNEEVTPDFLAQRVAQACGNYYALREGEGVELPSDPSIVLTILSTPAREEALNVFKFPLPPVQVESK